MKLRNWIKSRTALKHRELCRLINFHPTTFCLWMKGEKNIPEKKKAELEEILTTYYGYKKCD